MNESHSRAVFCSRSPLDDLLSAPRLSPFTNVGWGEEGLMSLVEPRDVRLRMELNNAPALSLARDVGWGESSYTTAIRDIAIRQRYLAALSFKNRTSSVRVTQAQAAAPLAIQRK